LTRSASPSKLTASANIDGADGTNACRPTTLGCHKRAHNQSAFRLAQRNIRSGREPCAASKRVSATSAAAFVATLITAAHKHSAAPITTTTATNTTTNTADVH